MAKLNSASRIVLLLVVVGVAAAIVVHYGPQPQPLYTNSTSTTSSGTTGNSSTPLGNSVHSSTAPAAPKPAPQPTLTLIPLIAPAPGTTWAFATQNTIAWSREANTTGQIELLNASTSALVGVILNEAGPRQTSYTWNTRDLMVSRTNPAKITVTPGTYIIKIAFDGNNLAPILSTPVIIQ